MEGGRKCREPTFTSARGNRDYSDLSLTVSITDAKVDWDERILPLRAAAWLHSLWTDGGEKLTACMPAPILSCFHCPGPRLNHGKP